MARINCTVDSCTYWDNNNICRAEEILVTINDAAGTARAEFGKLGGSTKPKTSYETQCKTFKPRETHGSDTDRK